MLAGQQTREFVGLEEVLINHANSVTSLAYMARPPLKIRYLNAIGAEFSLKNSLEAHRAKSSYEPGSKTQNQSNSLTNRQAFCQISYAIYDDTVIRLSGNNHCSLYAPPGAIEVAALPNISEVSRESQKLHSLINSWLA